MIKGKAKMEFGTGDIRMTGALSNGVGALCCITQDPHIIGEKVPLEDGWNVEQAEVILTFSRPESIDVLIDELRDIRAMMDGTYPFEEQNYSECIFDFDAFMKTENYYNPVFVDNVVLNRFENPEEDERDIVKVGDYVYAKASAEEYGFIKNHLYAIMDTNCYDTITVQNENGEKLEMSVENFSSKML